MVENVKRCGGRPAVLESAAWGQAIQPLHLREFLQEQTHHGDVKVVAFVHAETSTGALSDAAALCEIIREFNCLSVMDAVTSVGGVPMRMDDWGVDALYSGTQKCLSCPPGLSPVSFSEKALNKFNLEKHQVQSWFMDLALVQKYWGQQGEASHYLSSILRRLIFYMHCMNL